MRIYYYGEFVTDTTKKINQKAKITCPLEIQFAQLRAKLSENTKPTFKVRYYNA